ncbi:protein tyrosine kinase [Actinomadura pelletieri DSM 43383]|uniref:non-specific serine/threonine protein kinase n=1 Tax=Actinomadura pelletieri DSM 43383 TaxID=1120940 RepID=A0A495QJ10_9ACTN|nr:protein kinase [Actinomadura pelletieri]RKS72133.1 protein tyrosine kinase [Actinomadura pelletieri DSM 43383]
MESGLRLAGRYRLVERLDACPDGGLEVWRGRDELLDRTVAVKLLVSARGDLRQAFQEGVNRAAGLSHPALERVYDSDQIRDASGRLVCYVVTEFLDGETLAERLRSGPLSVSVAVGVCAQIAGAVAAAHAAGVAHGGLRAGKVVLASGDVKVVDTGLGGLGRGVAGPQSRVDDVRALGAIVAACVPAGVAGGSAVLAERCLAATAVDGPSAAEIAGLLGRDEPSTVVFTARGRGMGGVTAGLVSSRDRRTKTLRPPVRRRRSAGVRLSAVALVVAVPVVGAVAVLVSAPRSPVIAAPSPAATSRGAEPGGVVEALGRLRPIVSRGYVAGEIRSDAAIDLNEVIMRLEDDLTGRVSRRVVYRRLARLKSKIVGGLRERALSRGVAERLYRVLATIQV